MKKHQTTCTIYESGKSEECTCTSTVSDLLKSEYWGVMHYCTNVEYDTSVLLNRLIDIIIEKYGHYQVIPTEKVKEDVGE